MVCYHPIKGWRSKKANENGNYPVVFNLRDGYEDRPVTVPCGQCIGCRLERSRQWAIRCLHEASLNEDNCFITLTYNNEHLPKDLSLDIRHFQLFMKRLRKKYTGKKIRFFHCGEYGETLGRPHYHALLFGHDFDDKKLWSMRQGVPLYRSATLETLWPFGYSSVGEVTFESAAYVARYVMKKVNGDLAADHYTLVNEDGEYWDVQPEYCTMSRRPGLASDWLKRFNRDVYPNDEVIIRGVRCRPPRFYDRSFELMSPEEWRTVRARRRTASEQRKADATPERLKVRERCQLDKLSRLPRKLE